MESYYKCLTCEESFDDLREVKCHQHQETCKYFCERCRRQLDTKLGIVIHVIEHNIDDGPDPEYECEQCFLEFYNLDEYEHHRKSCPRGTDGSSVVALTNFNSSDSNNIRSIHQKTEQQNVNTSNSKCVLNISDSDNIPEETKYYCKYCNKSFHSQSELNKHLTTNIEGQQYGCNECGKFFLYKGLFIRHIERHNTNLNGDTDEKRFKCKYCNRRFRRRTLLNNHVRIHTGEKPFNCKFCGKCFPTRSALSIHIRVYTGEKTFKCKECGKCFRRKGTLNLHTIIHIDE